ncbi:MAG TPA: Jag N-terminal domain-containing protein, partial [Spirochaetota bacterium]|nr:Jag N-terminal domain-containing protein [Spirochaetota bacterium]
MGRLKELLRGIEDEDESTGEEVEVLADSVRQALELASGALKTDVSALDYDILQKGTSGFLGMGRQPYRVLVRASKTRDAYSDVDEIERKLSKVSSSDLSIRDVVKYADGSFKIRVTKTGVFLTVNPPTGGGQPVSLNDVNNRLFTMRIGNADMKKVEKEVARPSGPVSVSPLAAS